MWNISIINEANKYFGGVDILINNAGVGGHVAFQSPIENFPDKKFDDTIDLNWNLIFIQPSSFYHIWDIKIGKDHKYVECLEY